MRVAAGTPRAGRRPQELVADPDADASLSTALRKCLADACLDGEADQITEVVQNHVNFGAVRRSVRLEVEAELRQLMCRMNDCTDGLQSPRSAAVDVKSASSSAPSPSHASQHEGQGEGSAPWRNVDVPKGVPKLRRFQPARTYLSRAAAPEENGFNTSEAPGPRVSVPSPRAADIGRAAMSTPLSEASTSASSADAGTPRKGGKCTFAEGGVEQCPNEQDVTEGLTPSGTPKVHTRHSIARRLQERRRYEAGDADKVQDNRASASTVSSPSSNRRFGFNSEHTEQQDVEMQNPGTRHRQHTNGVGAQHLHMLSLLQQRCSMKQVGLLLTAQTRVHMQSLLSLSLAQHITRRILRVETRWVLGPLPIPCALPKVNTALSRRMQTLELQEDQPLMDQRVHVGVEGVPAYHHAHHRHQ